VNDPQQTHSSWVETAWSQILLGRGQGDAAQRARGELLVRYHEVVFRYFRAKLRDAHLAQELYSNFTLRLLETDALIRRADPDRGPFRRYLRRALRNMVRDHFRRQRTRKVEPLPDDVAEDVCTDDDFAREWRQELLNHAWKALAEYDRGAGSQHYAVLRFQSDHPDLSPEQLVEQLGEVLGKPMTPEAARQARHRARARFGQLLLAEVERSLHEPDLDELEQELADLELLAYCKQAMKERRANESGAP
jgi:RNA polymerase sigma factor (sigma-70 family)